MSKTKKLKLWAIVAKDDNKIQQTSDEFPLILPNLESAERIISMQKKSDIKKFKVVEFKEV
jgi:hypothetical protein